MTDSTGASPPLSGSLRELSALLPAIEALGPTLHRVGESLLEAFSSGHKLLTAGNGGSAADAMHLAEELTVRYRKNRRALPAVALTDPTALTCAGNDFGFETVFSRLVEALGQKGDVLAVFSTSGNSVNILRAVEAAERIGMTTVAFIGKDGGKLKGRCTFELHVPSQSTARVQEGHMILYHTLCEYIDARVD
jgi:D-sedoheptulose 7-phosphate isomerase